MEQDEGIIIRLQALGDTSLIVTWITREHGLIRTAAKGARNPKSAFHGNLDLYFSAQLSWAWAKKSDLHYLREVMLSKARLNLRHQWQKLRASAWFSHLYLACLEEQAPEPSLHQLLELALDYLTEQDPQEKLLARFETRLARELGLGEQQAGLNALQENFTLDLQKRPFSIIS